MAEPSLNTIVKLALSLLPMDLKSTLKLQKLKLVTDQQFKNSIFNELDDLKSKLKGKERKDLFSCVALFKDGLISLYKTLCDSPPAEEIKPGNFQGALENAATVAFGGTDPLSKYLENMTLASLTLTQKQNLEIAKSKFKTAKEKAKCKLQAKTIAESGTTTSDKILVTRFYVMATILQLIDQPCTACEECRLYLKETHAVSEVKEAFTGHLKKGLKSFFKKQQYVDLVASICHLNQVAFEFTLAVGGKVSSWPCIDVEKKNIRPVADARISQMLHDINFGHYDIQLSFGQGGKLEENLHGAEDVTFNLEGLCIVADLHSHQVKVYSKSKVFLYHFALPDEQDSIFCPLSVKTDSNNNLHVLAMIKPRGTGNEWRGVVTFDRHGNVSNRQPLKNLFVGWSFDISSSNKIFVAGLQQKRFSSWQEIQIYNFHGELIESFGKGRLVDAGFLTTAFFDDTTYVLVTDFGGQCVHIFDEHGFYVRQFKTQGSLTNAGGLGFSLPDKKIVVATISTHSHEGQVEFYETDGTLHHTVALDTDRDPILKGVAIMSNGLVAVVDKTQQRILVI